MRLPSKWRAYLLKSPAAYLLLATGPSNGPRQQQLATAAAAAATMKQHLSGRGRSGGAARSWRAANVAGGGGGGGGESDSCGSGGRLAGWMRLLKRRLAVACRPRNIARFFGALLVACLLLLVVSKGFGARRRGGACRCSKFTFSQCQPYDGGRCGAGTKRAFCQQKRCMPRRKLVRCTVPCSSGGEAAAAAAVAAADIPSKLHQQQLEQQQQQQQTGDASCIYAPRRQSLWTKCSPGVDHRSRILFLQSGPPGQCSATKTERRGCKSTARLTTKSCIYEVRGAWSQCNRQRNEIVNTRRLIDGTVNNCPAELVATMRCLKRDGTPKCIYSKWTRWTKCSSGSRRKTRALIQGSSETCSAATSIEQNCVIVYPFVPEDSDNDNDDDGDTILRK